MAEILTLILAPLSIALLVLYLQQLAQTRLLREERKAALDKLAEAKKKIEGDAKQHAEAERAAKEQHAGELERHQKELSRAHGMIRLNEAMIDSMQKAQEGEDIFPPGANPGL